MTGTSVEVRPTLAELEATVERGLATFVEVGAALLAIRDRRLYREAHGTFEDYCRERWRFSRPRAYQMIEAAEVMALVSTNVDIAPPTNEAQARELAPLVKADPEAAREAWAEARAEHGDKLTAQKVRRVVDVTLLKQITPDQVDDPMRPEAGLPADDDPADALELAETSLRERERVALLDALWRVVHAARVAAKFADGDLAPRVAALLTEAEQLVKVAEEAR